MVEIAPDDLGGSSDSGASTSGGLEYDPNTGTFVIDINVWQALLDSAPPKIQFFLRGIAALSFASIGWLLAFADDPIGFLRAGIEELIFRDFLLPLASSIYYALLGVLTSIAVFLFGPDFAVGRPVGLIDSPFALSGPIATAVQTPALAAIDVIDTAIESVAAGIPTFGLAATTVVTTIWVLLAAAFAWALWILFSSVDVPVVNPKGFLLAITRPIRNLLGAFR